jgi:hypothetical protein
MSIGSPRRLTEDTWSVDVDGTSVVVTSQQLRSPVLLQRRLIELLNVVVSRDALARALRNSPDGGARPSL